MTRPGLLQLVMGVLAALLFATTPARAQTDPRLVEAVRAAQEGNSDSARNVVRRLLAATPPTDSLYPEILYTQAMVAGDAAEMRRSLQRVVVEHGGSVWADDALLRLVQMDYAVRDLESAARNLERLRSDYPITPLLPQAAYWAGRIYFDLGNAPLACRWLGEGLAQSQDIELRNRLDYLNQRCAAAAQARPGADTTPGQGAAAAGQPDTSAAPAPTPTPPPPSDTARDTARAAGPVQPQPTESLPGEPAAQAQRFRVQIAAVATPGAADDAATAIEELGYQAAIVREGKLYKVRAGPFASRDEARAALEKLKARVGGSPFIVADN